MVIQRVTEPGRKTELATCPPDGAAAPIVLNTALAAALGNVIQTVGKPEFFHCLLEFLTGICPMHSGGAMIFSRHQRPQLLLYRRWTSARLHRSPALPTGCRISYKGSCPRKANTR